MTECPPNFSTLNNKIFILSTYKEKAKSAQTICNSVGGKLAEILDWRKKYHFIDIALEKFIYPLGKSRMLEQRITLLHIFGEQKVEVSFLSFFFLKNTGIKQQIAHLAFMQLSLYLISICFEKLFLYFTQSFCDHQNITVISCQKQPDTPLMFNANP